MRLKFIFRIFLFLSFLFGQQFVMAQNQVSYAEAMKSANQYFADKDYQNAKSYYQIALNQKPGDENARNGLKKSLGLLRDAMEVKYQYQDELDIANGFFNKGDYEKAIASYEKAAKILPKENYPAEQIKKARQLMVENADKQKEFDALIAKSDDARAKRNYQQAIDFMNSAVNVFPSNEDTKQKLADLKKEQAQFILDRKKFNEYVRKADYLFDRRRYEDALKDYEAAAELFPDAKEVVGRLNALPALISKQARYNSIINTSDSLYVQKQFRKAKAMYQEAALADPNENYPMSMIAKIDEELANRASSIEEEFKQAIEKGDEFFANQQWEQARTEFALAKSLKPRATYPPQKLEVINAKLAEIQAENERNKELNDLLALGSTNFNAQQYDDAKDAYNKVLKLDKANAEALQQLEKIDAIQDQMAADKDKKENFDKLVAKANADFEEKDYQDAIKGYEAALVVFPEDGFAQQRLTDSKAALAAMMAAENLEREYKSLMDQGEDAMKNEQYAQSKKFYQDALLLKPEDALAKSKVEDIDNKLALIAQNQSKEENYKSAMDLGAQYFEQSDLLSAKEQYQKALEIFPERKEASSQIEKIDSQLLAQQKQRELEDSYAVAVRDGESYLTAEDYVLAKENFEKASALKPNEQLPKDKLAEIQSKLDIIAANKAKQEEFDGYIKQADMQHADLNYAEALSFYEKANELIPGQTGVAEKIATVKAEMASAQEKAKMEADFNNFIVAGDSLYNAKLYDEAITQYDKAKGLKPDELYPRSQINKIAGIKAEIERQKQIDADYQMAITQGDEALKEEKWGIAKERYQSAAALKADETYPKTKLAEIDQILVEKQAEIDEQYNEAIANADREFDAKNYQEALTNYKVAASLKSDETYPRQKATEVEKIIEAEQKALMAEYNQVVGVADNYYNTKAYDKAIAKYEEAKTVKSDETYPQEMIDKITKFLEENAIVSLDKSGEAIASNTTKKVDFEPIPTNLRKSNFLLVRAVNPGSTPVKVQVSYGNGSAKNGGAVISVEPGGEPKDYLIRIGSQYKWFSQDNNWLSFYPQNGEVEIKLVQISKGE